MIIKSKQRNSNIEIFRFVLMCFILFWHILVHGYNLKMMGGEGFHYPNMFLLDAFFLVLFAPATYSFVFISGYYGIHFNLKRLITLLLWCSLISVGAYFYSCFSLRESFDILDFMRSLFPITSRKWWFMTEFVILYILSPIMNLGFDSISQKQQKILLFLLFLFSFMGVLLIYPNQGSDLKGLILIYLLARYLKTNGCAFLSFNKSALIYIISFSILFLGICVIYYISNEYKAIILAKLIFPFLGYANPFIIVMAVTLFFMVKNIPSYSNKFLNKILKSNLFIYLITEIGCFVSYKNLAHEFSENFISAVFHSLMIIAICMLVGHIVIYIVELMFRLVRKIELSLINK